MQPKVIDLRVVNFIALALQILASLGFFARIVGGSDGDGDETGNPDLVWIFPARYAFNIFPVIYGLLTLFVLYQLLPQTMRKVDDASLFAGAKYLIDERVSFLFALSAILNVFWMTYITSLPLTLSFVIVLAVIYWRTLPPSRLAFRLEEEETLPLIRHELSSSSRPHDSVLSFIAIRLPFALYFAWISFAAAANILMVFAPIDPTNPDSTVPISRFIIVLMGSYSLLALFLLNDPILPSVAVWTISSIPYSITIKTYPGEGANEMILTAYQVSGVMMEQQDNSETSTYLSAAGTKEHLDTFRGTLKMCYVKSAPAFTQQQQQQQQTQQQILNQAAASGPVKAAAPFSFADLSLDNFNEASWLSNDADSILGNPFNILGETATMDSMDFGLNLNANATEDFLPWLESITAATPAAAIAATVDQLPSPPQSSSPDLIMNIKQDPSASPYLPSPNSGASDTFSLTASSVSPAPEVAPPSTFVALAPAYVTPVLPAPAKKAAPIVKASTVTPAPAPAAAKKTTVKKRAASEESEDEEVVLKRMKNTEAARRSRARKLARLECLEGEVSALEHDKATLLVRLAVLESEQATFAQREADLNKRITQLELQLAESHRAMVLGMHR
ncbi:hypothetical protein HDU97_002858 [Phlyctochytrium planicorne]|nr:hypothetical protein HDU97_002858 [Phlyctochytrium planicorne]